MQAFYLLNPCGELTQDDVVYKAPPPGSNFQIYHIEGKPLPEGFVFVTKHRNGTGPFTAVPKEDLRSVLEESENPDAT